MQQRDLRGGLRRGRVPVRPARTEGRTDRLILAEMFRDHDMRPPIDDVTPNAQAVDRLAAETVDRITLTHRSILRAVDDRYRGIVAEVTATPLLGTGTRRQATQDAMRRFADEGIRSFTDRAGRR